MYVYNLRISRFGMNDREPRKLAEITLLDEEKPCRERMEAVMSKAVGDGKEECGRQADSQRQREKGGKERCMSLIMPSWRLTKAG